MKIINGVCWCGSGRAYDKCHKDFDKKLKIYKKARCIVPPRSIIKNADDIEGMKRSAAVNIAVLDYVGERICEGMTTEDINRLVHNKTLELGGIPAPLNYNGFPKSVCTSINEVVCHGIPSDKVVLTDGDIINVDVSTLYEGYFSDSSRMYMIGNVSPEKKRLVEVTKECVQKGLEQVRPWGLLGDVGYAVNMHAKSNGYTVVKEIGGHGIGYEFHEDPYVCFVTNKNTGMVMVPGMTFTIEPMVNMGRAQFYIDKNNGWTVYTDDGMPSAQWEITVLVTDTGYEVICY